MAASVQRGSADMTGSTSTDVTISSVDTSKARVKITIRPTAWDVAGVWGVKAVLLNATTIRLTRISSARAAIVQWEVCEWSSGMTVQRGSSSITSTGGTATLSSVDTSKAWAEFTSTYNASDRLVTEMWLGAAITAATTLTFYKLNSADSDDVGWQVMEYAGASVQLVTSSTWTGTSGSTAISAVTLASSIVKASNYAVSGAYSYGYTWPNYWLSDTTHVSYAMATNPAASGLISKIQVISFTDGTTVAHYTGTIASGTSTSSISITAVSATAKTTTDLGCALGFSNARSAGTGGNTSDIAMFSEVLTDTTHVTLQRQETGVAIDAYYVDVTEWASGATFPGEDSGYMARRPAGVLGPWVTLYA